MLASEQILHHLPYLRRFARAVSGSQSSGDAYVASLLELLADDPSILPREPEPRVALFAAFARIWNSLSINFADTNDNEAGEGAANRTIERITPLPRQAFLLHSVEEFNVKEIARILQLPVSEVVELIDEAGREIAREISTDILIIEDEPIISFDLEAIVESLGHRVMSIARTRNDAVQACKIQRPGLILADIELAGEGTGLDAVDEILKSIEVPVIFVTAYPERLLTGKRPEPTYLVTKPYRGETIKAIISQSLFFDERAHRLARDSEPGGTSRRRA